MDNNSGEGVKPLSGPQVPETQSPPIGVSKAPPAVSIPQPPQPGQPGASLPQAPPPQPVQQVPSPEVPPKPVDSQQIPTEQPISDKSKGTNILIWILVATTLIAAAIAGFFIGNTGLLTDQSILTPTPTQSPNTSVTVPTTVVTNTPSPEPVIGTKTYSSSKFTFEYPSYFTEIALKEEVVPATFESTFVDPDNPPEGAQYSVLLTVIGPEPNPESYKLKQWLGEYGKLELGAGIETTIDSESVGGATGMLISGYPEGSSYPSILRIYFELDDGIYSVGFEINSTEEKRAVYEEDFEEIMSSITFL